MLVSISRLKALALRGGRLRRASAPPSSCAPAASAARGWHWPAAIWCERTSASTRSAARLKLARDRGHLVAARLVDALAERAGTEALDALLAAPRAGASGGAPPDRRRRPPRRTAAPAAPADRRPAAIAAASAAPAGGVGARPGAGRPIATGRSCSGRSETRHAGRITHSVRPSSSLTALAARPVSASRRRTMSDAAMRSAAARRRAPAAGAGAATSRAAPRPAPQRGASAPRQRALDQLGPGAEALGQQLLVARTRSLSMCAGTTSPSANGEQRQHRHDGERRCAGRASSCRARVRAAGAAGRSARWRAVRRPACARTRSPRRARSARACGAFGSSSIAARMREMCTSIERSKASSGWPLQRIHDLVARQHAAGALRQHDQQVELVAGQVAGLAVQARLARAEVDLEAAEAQHLVVAATGAARARSSALTRASSSRGSNGLGR